MAELGVSCRTLEAAINWAITAPSPNTGVRGGKSSKRLPGDKDNGVHATGCKERISDDLHSRKQAKATPQGQSWDLLLLLQAPAGEALLESRGLSSPARGGGERGGRGPGGRGDIQGAGSILASHPWPCFSVLPPASCPGSASPSWTHLERYGWPTMMTKKAPSFPGPNTVEVKLEESLQTGQVEEG